jgi:hypothetical protein
MGVTVLQKKRFLRPTKDIALIEEEVESDLRLGFDRGGGYEESSVSADVETCPLLSPSGCRLSKLS